MFDSIPVELFVMEMLNHPEFARSVVSKFLDVNQVSTKYKLFSSVPCSMPFGRLTGIKSLSPCSRREKFAIFSEGIYCCFEYSFIYHTESKSGHLQETDCFWQSTFKIPKSRFPFRHLIPF